ncbi:MAG: zinc ribbon domain-containing protein [Chloroflexi bacterium]|nr:zinc ribbon domain-containing protein [Chloroflexota bacterium]
MEPSPMPRYDISNDGMGPYAIFYCDRDEREYRSNPSIGTTIKENVQRGALGGFLRNIPIVGASAANEVENDRYRTDMSPQELQSAWDQTRQFFRECPTCRQIVCIPDFDEPAGFCDEDSPRAAEVEAAKAQQAAQAWKGIADAFGVTGAIQKGMANAAAQAEAGQATCPTDGTKAPAGTRFCPHCGSQMTQPGTSPAAAAGPSTCASCGTALAAGMKFCPDCGAAAPQPKACASCGTQLTADAKFCPNCGTPSA